MRSDALDRLTPAGWAALRGHGIRTIVDLRNDDERTPDASPRPEELTTVHLPLDGVEDTEFWERWARGPEFGTPLYYAPHLNRLPERTARVISAIAQAPPGGVLVHCVGGRDRTGQATMAALALAGVEPEEIATDYELSAGRLHQRYAALGEPDQNPEIDAFFAREGTSAREVLLATLATLDMEATLRHAGLSDDDLAALRVRLVG